MKPWTTRARALSFCLLAAGLIAVPPAQAAEHAHQHGVARLDIAVEANRLTLRLDSPLDNLIGFEHAPRTDAERRLADAAVARLKSASMFVTDAAAQCKPVKVELASAALGLGTPDPSEAEAGHADLDAEFEFDCVDASKAAQVEVDLFSFPRLQRLEIQIATGRGQFKRELKRPARRISLTR